MKLKTGLIITAIILFSNGEAVSANEIFSEASKTEVINNLAKALKDKYVLVDEGLKFSEEIVALKDAGEFNRASDKEEFVQQVNKRLRQITNDKHVSLRPESSSQNQGRRMVRRVVNQGQESSPAQTPNSPQASGQRRMVRVSNQDGQSLKKMMGLPDTESLNTEILPGNIGLLTVNDLMGSVDGVNKAMAKLADTDGLIIDVRQCPGGSGDISAQISSYFLAEGEEIMRLHTRGQDPMINRSVKLPKGAKRYLGKPFYLVTSGFTGSACEALSFALKYHELGIVYGETTAGAGHASTQGLIPVGHGLAAFIPNSKPEHPKHKGGFEKVGVTSDIQADSLTAVDQAYRTILSQLLEKDRESSLLKNAIISVTTKISQAKLEQVSDSRAYADLVGIYAEQNGIVLERGQLKFSASNGRKYPLKKVSKDLFTMVYARGDRKIRIDRDDKEQVIGLSISPDKGQTEWKFKQKNNQA